MVYYILHSIPRLGRLRQKALNDEKMEQSSSKEHLYRSNRVACGLSVNGRLRKQRIISFSALVFVHARAATSRASSSQSLQDHYKLYASSVWHTIIYNKSLNTINSAEAWTSTMNFSLHICWVSLSLSQSLSAKIDDWDNILKRQLSLSGKTLISFSSSLQVLPALNLWTINHLWQELPNEYLLCISFFTEIFTFSWFAKGHIKIMTAVLISFNHTPSPSFEILSFISIIHLRDPSFEYNYVIPKYQHNLATLIHCCCILAMASQNQVRIATNILNVNIIRLVSTKSVVFGAVFIGIFLHKCV